MTFVCPLSLSREWMHPKKTPSSCVSHASLDNNSKITEEKKEYSHDTRFYTWQQKPFKVPSNIKCFNPTRLKVFKFAPLDFIPIIKLFHKKRFQNDHPGHTLAVLTFLTRFIMLFKSDSLFLWFFSVLPWRNELVLFYVDLLKTLFWRYVDHNKNQPTRTNHNSFDEPFLP